MIFPSRRCRASVAAIAEIATVTALAVALVAGCATAPKKASGHSAAMAAALIQPAPGATSAAAASFGPTAKEPGMLVTTGDITDVHDPSAIAQDAGKYYLFGTGNGIPMRVSDNLRSWRFVGNVFSDLPSWAPNDVPGSTNIWAPDVSWFNGSFHLYYAISTFGSNHSDIGLATNATLDPTSPKYKWMDHGPIFRSRAGNPYNAIDPNLALDSSGQPWLAFGSFWSGIKLIKLDAKTGAQATGTSSSGAPATGDNTIHSLAERPEPPDAIEAPFIIHRDSYYYLFASYDFCCRGSDSTYNIRVGRSSEITGPYVDKAGVPMLRGGGTIIAQGNGRWRGPGGESLFQASASVIAAALPGAGTSSEPKSAGTSSGGAVDSRWVIVYHTYDAENGGIPTMQMNVLDWDAQGWPVPITPVTQSAP